MRKVLALILAIALPLGLTACGWFKTPEPTQPETTAQTPPVVLYLPNEHADGFVVKAAHTDGTIEDIVALLVGEGALPEGCAPLSFSLERASLDMNEAFRLAVSTTGTTGEYLFFGSLVNTVLGYYGLEVLYVKAQGDIIETGHTTYDFVFRFYPNQIVEREEDLYG